MILLTHINSMELFTLPPIFYWLFILAAVVAIAILIKKTSTGKKSRYSYLRKKYFISRAEHEFYNALVSAVGNDYYVFAQVHLPTLVDHKIKGQNWQGAFSHINRKSVDFVLCDKAYISPILAIELDDKSHLSVDRRERDSEVERILSEAGLPLLRIENHGTFDLKSIASEIKQKIDQNK